MKNNRGFTLIELLITIAIIGALAAVSVTSYVGVIKKAARSEAYSNLENLRLLEEQAFADSGNYSGPAVNTAAVQVLFPRFIPGADSNFTYAITSVVAGTSLPNPAAVPYDGATATPAALNPVGLPATPCYIVTATGIANTRVAGDVFAIDCINNRNF